MKKLINILCVLGMAFVILLPNVQQAEAASAIQYVDEYDVAPGEYVTVISFEPTKMTMNAHYYTISYTANGDLTPLTNVKSQWNCLDRNGESPNLNNFSNSYKNTGTTKVGKSGTIQWTTDSGRGGLWFLEKGDLLYDVYAIARNDTKKTIHVKVTQETNSRSATWNKDRDGWKYMQTNGAFARNKWLKISGKWYRFNSNQKMVTGWKKVSGKWYYMDKSGAMQTGWKKSSGKWYYLESSGAMATSKWIGKYYVEADGAMATNKWIGKYHVGSDGKWDKTKK